MNDLTISLIQTSLHWHNPKDNRSRFEQLIKEPGVDTDVIILPEMFTTGFTMKASDNAEPQPGDTLRWMQQQAQKSQAVITGSITIKQQDNFFNRLYWVKPDGNYQYYDKKHLFSYADENQHFTAGSKRLIVDHKGWRICPLICYDLRFPVWSRNDVDYDLLIYVANWPAPRQNAWHSLLKARAIENMSYVAGVNRIGTDGNDHNYLGGSVVYDVLGDELFTAKSQEINQTITLNYEALQQQRKRFGFLKDRDPFTLK